MAYFFKPILMSAWLMSFALGSVQAQSQPNQEIDDMLTDGADAVVRQSDISFNISAINAATLKVERTITILNEAGKQQAVLAVRYDQHTHLKQADYQVINAKGHVVEQVTANDMEDIGYDEGEAYADYQIKYYQPQSNEYPYTIRYTYDIAYDGILFYPDWYPQDGYELAVEQSSFTISIPDTLSFRYLEHHMPDKLSVRKSKGIATYTWKVGQIAALKAEPWGPSLSQLVPSVRVAPDQFEYEDCQGDMTTWESFGQWVYQRNQGKRTLSEKTVREMHNLTAGIGSPQLKAKKLYEYMQSKTRYADIPLGVDGYQALSAATVDTSGYGDSKSLSNYMIALLSAMDIPAYFALVQAGKNAPAISNDFPSGQFNHVIVCVPLLRDTLWLECSSQTNPAGFLGYLTSNRDVLIINQQGGHLAKTPAYAPTGNLQSRTASVTLDKNGNGDASITTLYTGLQYMHIENIAHQSGTLQRSHIYQKTGIADFDLTGYSYDLLKEAMPVAREELSLHLNKYAEVQGGQLLFNPNLLNRINFILPVVSQRNTEIVIHHAYLDVDSILFDLPDGMQPEHLPEPVNIRAEFGKYEARYVMQGNRLLYVRKLKTTPGKYASEYYETLRLFYERIGEADKTNVVIKTNS